MRLAEILRAASEHGASDIHVIPDHPPMMRVNTVITPLDMPVVDATATEAMLRELVSEQQFAYFKEKQDLDFSFAVQDFARYRVNAHMQRGTIGMARTDGGWATERLFP